MWNRDAENKVITFYHDNPCLWNPQNEDYKNKQLRNTILSSFAAKLGPQFDGSAETIAKRFRNLRTTFSRECKKILEAKRLGLSESHYVPKWDHFNKLMFLKDTITHHNDTRYSQLSPIVILDTPETDEHLSDEDELQSRFSLQSAEPSIPSMDDVSTLRELRKRKQDVGSVYRVRNESVYRSYLNGHEEDADDVFGRSVTLQLKELNQQQKDFLKMKIQMLIYEVKYNEQL